MEARRWLIRPGTSAGAGLAFCAAAAAVLVGCLTMPTPDPDPGSGGQPPGGNPAAAIWTPAFDASRTGVLSSVWGSAPDDVFVVGGQPEQGEVYHFDGSVWRGMEVPIVPLLVWVFGFGPDNVYSVGVGGGAIHYDGQRWTTLSSGTTEDLWGIWGKSPDDLWVVGGRVGVGQPVILHYDGSAFTPVAAPPNDRGATSLFKVWGIGSKVFAVGEHGLILSYAGGIWAQAPAGANADDDFVSLWGTSESNIVAVGGRSGARVAVYDGTQWSTQKPAGTPGLNGVFPLTATEFIIGGINGYAGNFNPASSSLSAEPTGTGHTLHAVWYDGVGRCFSVGGRFTPPFEGLALVRTIGDPGIFPAPLIAPVRACEGDGDCPAGQRCVDGACEVVPGCDGPDPDDDGWRAPCDNCPLTANADQADSDGDGAGDACDACPGFPDGFDADGDGAPNGCDFCPHDPGKTSPGTCGCGTPDADSDGDGVPDCVDVCPGFDDGLDSDGDGTPNGCDTCPNDPNKVAPGACGCGTADTDSDGDGTPNCLDACPNDANKVSPGVCGCGTLDTDSDGDGRPDCIDECVLDADSDGDGVDDCLDDCPNDPNKTEPGACGCGTADTDSDGDATPNCLDACPNDPNKVAPGVCGCGTADTDSDGDATPNCRDACPNDPNKVSPGVCGCGTPDIDSDGDGTADCVDPCPNDPANLVCGGQGDCPLGRNCTGGCCTPTGGPDLVLQQGFPPFAQIPEGGAVFTECGFQGLSHTFVTFRVSEFSTNLLKVSYTVTLNDAGGQISSFGPANSTFALQGDGTYQSNPFQVVFDFPRCELDNRPATITVQVSDRATPPVTVANLTQTILIDVNLADALCNCE